MRHLHDETINGLSNGFGPFGVHGIKNITSSTAGEEAWSLVTPMKTRCAAGMVVIFPRTLPSVQREVSLMPTTRMRHGAGVALNGRLKYSNTFVNGD
ncbi:MAG: hypothetical protein HZA88_06105 [Verrucomicrobia bacterium]|nr:hypothetical protein [Verrucomicrobiota bacterium]